LLFKPTSSEELVALHAVAVASDAEIAQLEMLFKGPNGVAEALRLITGEGLKREYQRHYSGAATALGPKGAATPPLLQQAQQHQQLQLRRGSGSRAAGSIATTSNATSGGSSNDPDGLPLTRPQLAVLTDAMTWPAKIRGDAAICQSVLDAEKTALTDKLAYRVTSFSKDLADMQSSLTKLGAEGNISRYQTIQSTIRTLQSRFEAALTEVEAINQQQELLEQPVINYSSDIRDALSRLGNSP
jgi:hypothetical protein